MKILELVSQLLKNKFNEHTILLNNIKKYTLTISNSQVLIIPEISNYGFFKIFDSSNPINNAEISFLTGTGTRINQPSFSSLFSINANTNNKLNIYMIGSILYFQSRITGIKIFTIFVFKT